MHALRSLAELLTAYVLSEIGSARDEKLLAGLRGFTEQPSEPAEQELTPDAAPPSEEGAQS